MENKAEKFKKSAELRVNNTLRQMNKIQNLSNNYYYEWNDKEAEKIIDALTKGVQMIKEAFNSKKRKRFNF